MPEVNIPDVVLTQSQDEDSSSHSSDVTSDSSQSGSGSSQTSFEIPTLNMDDIEIPDLFLGSTPNLNVDNGPKLYAGARVTNDQAIYMLVSWFSSYPGISKSAFSRLLYILNAFILPTENNLPQTYDNLQKKIKPFLSPIVDYHCCVNDCVVFRDSDSGKYSKLLKCPMCNEDRYEHGTKIPRKRFKYLPLENRVRRLFADPKTSKLLQNHTSSTCTSNIASDIHHSEAWKSLYSSTGIFTGDSRSLSFAVCLDGLNPFSREKNSYSTCPIILTILNLPPYVRRQAGSMMLTGLIPGPREPKNTNPYVDVLVDDIMHLNTLTIHDGYKQDTFSLKANIVLNIFDYVGQNKVLQCQGVFIYS